VAGYETDRARFLGRGGTVQAPAALQVGGGGLSGTTGATLDPIFALQSDVTVQSFDSTQVAFVTLAAASRKEAIALAERFSRWGEQARSVDQMSAGAREELVQLELDSPQLEQIQKLLSTLLYPNPALRAEEDMLVANSLGQPGLWPLSISGDYPILLVRVANEQGLPLVAELLRAHTYWRGRDLTIDMVILNQRETGYQQELQGKLYRLLARTKSDDCWKRGGIFMCEKTAGPRSASCSHSGPGSGCRYRTLAQLLQKLEHPPVRLRASSQCAPRPKAEDCLAGAKTFGLAFRQWTGRVHARWRNTSSISCLASGPPCPGAMWLPTPGLASCSPKRAWAAPGLGTAARTGSRRGVMTR
jgi:hypothetical protein